MGGAGDFIGDVAGDIWHAGKDFVDEVADLPGDLINDPLGTLQQGMNNISRGIRGIGEGVLSIPKWGGDILEWTGKRTGIEPIENIGDTIGDISRDKRLEVLAGAVAMYYAAPYLASYVQPYAGSLSLAPQYATPALMEAQAAGTVAGPGMLSGLYSNAVGALQTGLAGLASASPLEMAGEKLTKEGLKLGVDKGIQEFIIEPAIEKYQEAMRSLQGMQAPKLLNYSYKPQGFTTTTPDVSNLPIIQATAGMQGAPDMSSGFLTKYLENYQDYWKMPLFDKWFDAKEVF